MYVCLCKAVSDRAVRAAVEAESEERALKLLAEGIGICAEENDLSTREFLAQNLAEEESHLDWIETQLRLIGQIGEANYLAQQVRD